MPPAKGGRMEINMKDLLNKRINNIQTLEDRKVFRDIINHVFMDLVDYQERQIESLKNNIFDEMSVSDRRPVIYGTMIKKYEYDDSDDFMFPMSIKDVELNELSAEEINKSIVQNKSFMIGKTFLKCDCKTLDKLFDSGRIFEGKIYTDAGVVGINVRLCRYKSYEDMLGHLYSVFIKNGLEWTTPNLPYIRKFAAFMIDTPLDISNDAVIEKVEINLGEYEEYRIDDVLPVWNIQHTMVQSINFPIPTKDNVLKEHRFDVYDLSPYRYIPDFKSDDTGYVKRTSESVSVIIPDSEIREWPMYKVYPAVNGKHYVYPFEIYDNGPADNFYNGYLNAGCRNVRTEGEILRMLYSFSASDMFKITGYEMKEKKSDKFISDTYSVNNFILDEIRSSFCSDKVLIVYYSYKYDNKYVAADIMSFIISELQQYIPDIKCIGIERKATEE